MQMFSVIAQLEWQLGINDPTVIAWIIFGLYLVASLLCWRTFAYCEKVNGTRPRAWVILSLMLFSLAVNKQLDLHSLAIQKLREIPIGNSGKWLGYLLACAITTTLFFAIFRLSSSMRMRTATIALFSIVFLQAVRFANLTVGAFLSAHPISDDGLFHTHVIEILELFLISLICYCAYRNSSAESGTNEAAHQAA
jgi:hypothetical protein